MTPCTVGTILWLTLQTYGHLSLGMLLGVGIGILMMALAGAASEPSAMDRARVAWKR